MIPYGRQSIDAADIAAVAEVLRSDFLTQGPAVERFEQAMSAYCGAAHGVAACNATAALHLACLALDLGPGDLLWTSPITFVASANCALYCGAQVDFVDIDPQDWNISISVLEAKLAEAERQDRLPKVLVAVHLCGQPCDMRSIRALSRRYGFKVIEDASHAIGGRYLGAPIGDCRFSDITVFSFHPVKIITTIEGGMAVTNDPSLAESMALLRSHGITRNPAQMEKAPDGPWYYEQIALGYNYRMTDVQAALGVSQAGRIDEYVTRRHALANRYDGLLAGLPVRTARQHPDGFSGLHLYVIRLDLADTRCSHLEVFERLQRKGVGVNIHYIPVHLQPYYRNLGFREGDFPEAERYYAEAITLPMYPAMGEDAQDKVVDALREAVNP